MSEEEQIPKGWEIAILEDMLYYVQPISVHKKTKPQRGESLIEMIQQINKAPEGRYILQYSFTPLGFNVAIGIFS
jgi:hypothetical protein